MSVWVCVRVFACTYVLCVMYVYIVHMGVYTCVYMYEYIYVCVCYSGSTGVVFAEDPDPIRIRVRRVSIRQAIRRLTH